MKILKYGASSSLLIMDYNVKLQKFMVLKRIEVPKGDYSYDNAVKLIIELNEIYNPSWIYCDAGSGKITEKGCQKHEEIDVKKVHSRIFYTRSRMKKNTKRRKRWQKKPEPPLFAATWRTDRRSKRHLPRSPTWIFSFATRASSITAC